MVAVDLAPAPVTPPIPMIVVVGVATLVSDARTSTNEAWILLLPPSRALVVPEMIVLEVIAATAASPPIRRVWLVYRGCGRC